MTKNNVQVEVLLITTTSFLTRNWIKKEDNSPNRPFSETEQLQEACWNGLVQQMLPEVFTEPSNGGILYLWDIKETQCFLQLELSEFPLSIDRRTSITPHSFLCFQEYN
jgi:hypothetical protein